MAERLADIVAQIQNVRQLEAVVTAMRGIAAARAQSGRSLLPGIRAYAEVISRAIGQALSLLPSDAAALAPAPARPRRGFILFCAEQGFAGAYSERVLDAAAAELPGATILVVGTRGAALAEERGMKVAWSTPMASHADAIPGCANRLVDALYRHVAAGAMTTVDVLFARAVPGAAIQVDRHSLLPIDYARFARPVARQSPLITLPGAVLLAGLAAEYIYAQLWEAATHAFSAENEARMVAMMAAKTNIETKLAALSQHERQLRQQDITTEVIELAAGAAAARRGGFGSR